MKYRARPVIIEAEQWQPGRTVDGVEERIDARGPYGLLATPHGYTVIEPGDYVIAESGVPFLFYFLKPQEFERLYEPCGESELSEMPQ